MKAASRLERAQTLTVAASCRAAGQSERQAAASIGCARSTLRTWARSDLTAGDAPAPLAAFVATPAGVHWLHRLVLAIQFVITRRAGGGVRLASEVLELSGLSAFVGASYGTQQALNAALEQAVVDIAAEQRQALATVAFFFASVQQRVEALNLAPDSEAAVLQQLIPAIYLERVATRHPRAEERARLAALSAQLLAPLRAPDHPIQALGAEQRTEIEQVASDCADLFQRSSSAVKERNGQLSLFHHGCHHLSTRKLAALTAVHNFYFQRDDQTTAAERLFGRAPPPLFEQLLERVPLPPRPRRRRRRAPKLPDLAQRAA